MALTGTVTTNYNTLLNGTNTDLGNIFTNVYGPSSMQFIIGKTTLNYTGGIGSHSGANLNFTITIPNGTTPTLGILNIASTFVNGTSFSPYFSLSFDSCSASGTTCTVYGMLINSSGNNYGSGTPITGQLYYMLI